MEFVREFLKCLVHGFLIYAALCGAVLFIANAFYWN